MKKNYHRFRNALLIPGIKISEEQLKDAKKRLFKSLEKYMSEHGYREIIKHEFLIEEGTFDENNASAVAIVAYLKIDARHEGLSGDGANPNDKVDFEKEMFPELE